MIQPSAPFKMPRSSGQVVLEVDANSKVKRWIGLGLWAGGAAFAVGGLATIANANNNTNSYGYVDKDVNKTVGVTYLVIGVALAAVGFPMWLSNGASGVNVQ